MAETGLTIAERRRRAEEALAGCIVFRRRESAVCRKVAFATLEEARRAMRPVQRIDRARRRFKRADRGRVSAYFCHRCSAYHFGHRKAA